MEPCGTPKNPNTQKRVSLDDFFSHALSIERVGLWENHWEIGEDQLVEVRLAADLDRFGGKHNLLLVAGFSVQFIQDSPELSQFPASESTSDSTSMDRDNEKPPMSSCSRNRSSLMIVMARSMRYLG